MTYSATRDLEQQRILDTQIAQFMFRYQSKNILPAKRKTLILFVGGMASSLMRARTPYNPARPVNQTFQYDTVWLTLMSFLGEDALTLTMHKGKDLVAHDLKDRIVVANGSVSLFGITPYTGFEIWCDWKNVDLFIYGWDWRLPLDHCARFFVNSFLPALRNAVQTQTGNDPLQDLVLVGHSAGGMIVNLVMQDTTNPLIDKVKQAITVAAPFYGYGGELHRYFEGCGYFNSLGVDKVIKMIASCPGPYAYQYMDVNTYTTNAMAFQSDIPYVLMDYPSKDAAITSQNVDAYAPGSKRYPTGMGITSDKLNAAFNVYQAIAAGPPAGPRRDAFYCIRGCQDNNSTVTGIHWASLPTGYTVTSSPSPITNDPGLVPGDGTQPAWTARLLGLPNNQVCTVHIGPLGHMFMMDEPAVMDQIGTLIGV